jgi:hypothetical protein
VLSGKKVKRTTLLTPGVYDNADKKWLKANYFSNRAPTFSAAVTVPGYTTYKPADLLGCKGP